jgi:tellurite methyltransferase
MTTKRQQHWDEKWSLKRETTSSVCDLLIKYQAQLSPGRALDVACGLGSNAIWLAQYGFEVDAVDISPVAIERAQAEARQAGMRVNFIQADLESGGLPPTRFPQYDLIVVRRFLERSLLPALRQALAPNGWLFYQTFNQRKRITDREFPQAYLLEDGELLRAFGDLHVIEAGDNGGEGGDVSWIVAQNI